MKTAFIKIIVFAAIAITALVSVKSCIHLKKENRRLCGNVESLNLGINKFKTSDSLFFYTVRRLSYEKSELQKYQAHLVACLSDMGIKLANLENVTALNQDSYYHLKNLLRDSVRVTLSSTGTRKDTVHLKYIDYKSRWIDFNQVEEGDIADTKITVRDSILVALSWRRPHKFWFIRWGKPIHEESFKNYNPYSTIKYFISIDKL